MSSIERFDRWLRRLLCKCLGHAEAIFTAHEPDGICVVRGCERCDTVLSVEKRAGQYPLPRD